MKSPALKERQIDVLTNGNEMFSILLFLDSLVK